MGLCCAITISPFSYLRISELTPRSDWPEYHECLVKRTQGDAGVGAAETGESVALGRTRKREG